MDDPLPPQEMPVVEIALDPQLIADGDYDTGRLDGEFALTGDATGELFDQLADDTDED
jgi:hypothetical protein